MGSNIETIGVIDIDIADFSDAEIRREWRNIDILVVSPRNNLVVAIENKVGTSEHSDQLQRYKSILQKEMSSMRHLLVYLTPGGDQASDQDWIPFSYEGITTVVERILRARASVLGEDVKVLCKHYTTMVRRHIVSESEIAELCRKLYKHHRRAFDLVFEHRPDLQQDLSEFLQVLPVSKGPEHILDQCSKAYVRFTPALWDSNPLQISGSGWTKTKRVLLFEIHNMPESVAIKLIIGPGDTGYRSAIWDLANKDKSLFKGGLSKLYPKYSQIYVKKFLAKKDYEDPDVEDLKAKIQKRWDAFIEGDYEAILDTLSPLYSE